MDMDDFLESSDDGNSNSNINNNSNDNNEEEQEEDIDINVNSVKDWDTDDVSSWLDSVGLGYCKKIFEKEDIDGDVLLICDLNELSEHLRFIHDISFGNTVRVIAAIGNLRCVSTVYFFFLLLCVRTVLFEIVVIHIKN